MVDVVINRRGDVGVARQGGDVVEHGSVVARFSDPITVSNKHGVAPNRRCGVGVARQGGGVVKQGGAVARFSGEG